MHVDAGRAFRQWLEPRKDLLATIALRGTYLDSDDVERLLSLSLPGIDEVAALLEIIRLASPPYERVVVDTAPTGHTLRLLEMPSLYARVSDVLNAFASHHRGVVSALTGRYREDAADRLIESIAAEASGLTMRLRDAGASQFVWVTLPEPMALEESADAVRALRDAGIAVQTLVINRMAPAGGCAWDDARRRFEARAVFPVARRFEGLHVKAVPEAPAEPRGVRALTMLDDSCSSFRLTARPPAIPRRHYGAIDARRSKPVGTGIFTGRWLLFGGKGGVGKTTCSAAGALGLATAHPADRFLLLSTDPAHSLGDALGAAVTDEPRAIAGLPPNLDVREMDANAGLARFRQRYLETVDDMFTGIGRSPDASVDRGAFRDLIDLAPPGLDEVMAIAHIADVLSAEGPYRTVIADTAPTGHALRLLETPAILREWTQALMAVLLKYRAIVHAGPFAQLLVDLSKRLRSLEAMLRDASKTAFVIVTRAAALPREETLALRDSLDRLGVPVRAVIVNALGAGACEDCRRRMQREQREVRALMSGLGPRGRYAIIEAPSALPTPHGAAALLAWRSRWRAIEA
jgi:arsenite-transporting ATPase